MIRASLIDPPLINGLLICSADWSFCDPSWLIGAPLINGLLIRPSLIHPFQIHQDIPVTLNSYHV
jgi:hypothetical protein